MKKRIVCLLLAVCMLLPLLGCSETDADSDANKLYDELADYYKQKDSEKKTTLTSFALPYLQGLTLDPVTCLDGTQQDIGQLLYEGLICLNTKMEPEAVLADSWTYNSSTFTWAIHLRSGVTFSDGSALTASDVVATLQRARTSARYQGRFKQVQSIYADGSDTVVIRLTRTNSTFLSLLDIPIVKSGTETQTVPLGTGRYVFVPTSGTDKVHLSANTSWWQGKSLPLQRIELYTCKDNDTMSYAFYAREIQLLHCDLSATASTGAVSSGDYTDVDTTVMHYLGFNTAKAPFDNAALRVAVSRGIDRSGCVSSFLMGHGSVAEFPLSPASPLYPGTLATEYSSDHFNSSVSAAGFGADKSSTSVTLLVNRENQHKVDAAGKIAAALSDSALQVTVEAVPWATFVARLQSGAFDLYYGEYKMTADWDLTELLSVGGSANYGKYSDQNFTELLLAERSTQDTAHEDAALQLYTYLSKQMPIAPICFTRASVLTTFGAIEGLTPSLTDPFYNLTGWTVHIS